MKEKGEERRGDKRDKSEIIVEHNLVESVLRGIIIFASLTCNTYSKCLWEWV